jgi:hypothetical protein
MAFSTYYAPTAPFDCTMTQTVVTLSANVDTVLVTDNANRRYLALANIGTGLVSLAFEQAAVVNSGWPLAGAIQAGQQGGEMVWEASSITTQAIHGISSAGSVVVVIEGQ